MLPLETVKFCMRCGHRVELREESERLRPVCPHCGWVHYFAPQVAAVALLTHGADEVLLVQRGEDPGKGLWGLPGGFVELGETAEGALVREVLEETGYASRVGPILGVWSYFNHIKRIAGVALIYETVVLSGDLRLASDAVAAEWSSAAQALDFPLAFESHRQALQTWQAQLVARRS
jgi:ADP-ribose pyrophosphatase YjhB (NUDIX family)